MDKPETLELDEEVEWDQLPQPVQASIIARHNKKLANADLSPAQREDLWVREVYTKVVGICVRNGRRTLKGWIQNTKHTSTQKKVQLVEKMEQLVAELRASIPTEKSSGDEEADESALLDPFS